MAPTKSPTSIGDYTILSLTIPGVPSFPHPQTHYLYLRPHVPRDAESSSASTALFLVNIPIDSTPTHLRALFAHLTPSRISNIAFSSSSSSSSSASAPSTTALTSRKRKRITPTTDLDTAFPWPATWDRTLHPSGSTCVVTFVDSASATAAMSAVKKAARSRVGLPWVLPADDGAGKTPPPPLGLARYRRHHAMRFPDPETLKECVDGFMTAFNEGEEARRKEDKRRRQVPDEDGFVTVVRGGRAGVVHEGEARKGLAKAEKRMEGLEGFYRWQVREKRRDEEGRLKRGFEEERRRVQDMRRERGR